MTSTKCLNNKEIKEEIEKERIEIKRQLFLSKSSKKK